MATPPENARLYFKYRPTRLRLAADPGLTTHRAYGVPKPAPTPEFMAALETTRDQSRWRSSRAAADHEGAEAMTKLDGYADNETDQADMSGSFRSSRASS